MDLILKLALSVGLLWLLVRFPGLRRLVFLGSCAIGSVLLTAMGAIVVAIPLLVVGVLAVLLLGGGGAKGSTVVALMALDED